MDLFMPKRFSAVPVDLIDGNGDCDSACSSRHDDDEVHSSGHHGHSGVANRPVPSSSSGRGYGDRDGEEGEEDEDASASSDADHKRKEHTERTDIVVKEKEEKKKRKPRSGNVSAAVETVKDGLTCHWCRQISARPHVRCSQCVIKFCPRCLLNRNGESIEDEIRSDVHWVCPRCRGGCGPGCTNCCNCGPCRKSQGLPPTGVLCHTARDAGFTNAHDYLIFLKTGESAEVIAGRKNGRGWTCATGAIDLRLIFLWGKKGKRKPKRPRLDSPSSTSTRMLEDDMLCEMTNTNAKEAKLTIRVESEEQDRCTVHKRAGGLCRSSGELCRGSEEILGSENKFIPLDAMDSHLRSTNSDQSDNTPSTSMTVGGRECKLMPGAVLRRQRSVRPRIQAVVHDLESSPTVQGASALPNVWSPRGEAGSSLLRTRVRSTSPRGEGGSTFKDISSSPKGESGSNAVEIHTPRGKAVSTLLGSGSGSISFDVTSSPTVEGGGAVLDLCSPTGEAGSTLIRTGGGSVSIDVTCSSKGEDGITLPDAFSAPRGKAGSTSLGVCTSPRGEVRTTFLRTGGGSAKFRPGCRSSTICKTGSTSLGRKGLRVNLEELQDLNSSHRRSDTEIDLSRTGQETTGLTSWTRAERQVPSSAESVGMTTPVPAKAAGATCGQVPLCSPRTIFSSICESPVILSPMSADSGSSVITKAMLARSETEAAVITTTNNFKTELNLVLQKPHSDKQLRNMWDYFNFHRPTTEEADELRLCEHHLDLCRKLAKAVTPGVRLSLLRGFFFWLLHSDREGAFRPWGAEEIGDDQTGGYNLRSSESEEIAQLLACQDNLASCGRILHRNLPPVGSPSLS